MIIQLSSGQGPAECELEVKKHICLAWHKRRNRLCVPGNSGLSLFLKRDRFCLD